MPFLNPGFEDAGTSRGLADEWTLTESSDARVATYDDGGQPAIAEPPFESFRGGWLANEDSIFAFVGVGTDQTNAIFGTGPGATPSSIESFEDWSSSIFVYPSAVNAPFGGLAFVTAQTPGPYALADGDTITITRGVFSATSDPLAATRAVNTGASGAFPTGFVYENTFRMSYDGGESFLVELGAAQSLADIIGIINTTAGETLAFDAGGELEFRSPKSGNASALLIEEINGPRAIATNSAPYNIVDGTNVVVAIDGTAGQSIVFSTADFADIAAATSAEVADVINAQITGATAVVIYGLVHILSDAVTDPDAAVEVTGGLAAGIFDFPALTRAPLRTLGIAQGLTLGSGNVGDVGAVTAQELAGVINDTVDMQGLDFAGRPELDALRLFNTNAGTGTLTVAAGPITSALNLDALTASSTGIDADAFEEFESEWGTNEDFLLVQGPTTAGVFVGNDSENFEVEWKSNENFEAVLDSPAGAFYDNDPITTLEQHEDFDARFDVDFSVDPSTDIFTSIGHNIVTNITRVTVRSVDGQLPSPLEEGVVYFPTRLDSDTFELKETTGGAAIDITDNGSGVLRLKYSTLAYWTEELGI